MKQKTADAMRPIVDRYAQYQGSKKSFYTSPHKDLTITYNFLNLPTQIVKSGVGGGTITFTYDASGRKWRKQVIGEIHDYLQGIEYKAGKLEAIYGPEGRLTAMFDETGKPTHYRAEYWLKDHLGNTRLAISDEDHDGAIETFDDPSTLENDSEIMEENHYYPFGMNQEGPWYGTVGPHNQYQYNGKELNEDFGLNWYAYGTRYYDPAIGRFTGVDPISDKFAWVTPYNYAENEPVAHIDLHGLQKYFAANGDFIKKYGNDNSIRIVSNSKVIEFKNLKADDARLQASIPAYIHSYDNVKKLLVEWASEYRKKSGEGEYAMSLFTKNLTDENGSAIKVVTPGTTKYKRKFKGGGAEIDPNLSMVQIGDEVLTDWDRSSTIHTHPSGGADEFSGIKTKSAFFGGDVAWARENNVRIYLTTGNDYWIYVFNPYIYNAKVTRGSDGYIYRSDHEEAVRAAIKKAFFLTK